MQEKLPERGGGSCVSDRLRLSRRSLASFREARGEAGGEPGARRHSGRGPGGPGRGSRGSPVGIQGGRAEGTDHMRRSCEGRRGGGLGAAEA